jgi:hypothetical protein
LYIFFFVRSDFMNFWTGSQGQTGRNPGQETSVVAGNGRLWQRYRAG